MNHAVASHPTNPVPQLAPTLRSVTQRGIAFPALAAICDIRVLCAEHLAGSGAAIIVANHESILDSAIVMRALPAARRRVTAVTAAADVFFRSRTRSMIIAALVTAVPVERCGHGKGSAALDACADHIAGGGSVLIFPEGTRSRSGAMTEFRRGAARLAAATGAPVIPIGMHGAGTILPPGKRLPRPGATWLVVGAPITGTLGADCDQLTSAMETRVRQLRLSAMAAADPAQRRAVA